MEQQKSFKNKDAYCLSLRKELIVESAKFPQYKNKYNWQKTNLFGKYSRLYTLLEVILILIVFCSVFTVTNIC